MNDQPPDYSEVKRRYKVPAGRIMVARDAVDTAADDERYLVASRIIGNDGVSREIVAGDTDRATIAKKFEPWATVLLVGEARKTEYGATVNPPDGVTEGARILMAPTGGRDVTLSFGDVSMDITVIPFESVMMIDTGEVGDVQ